MEAALEQTYQTEILARKAQETAVQEHATLQQGILVMMQAAEVDHNAMVRAGNMLRQAKERYALVASVRLARADIAQMMIVYVQVGTYAAVEYVLGA